MMGGGISVQSEVGKGSVFTARLPLTVDDGAPAEPSKEAADDPAGDGDVGGRVPYEKTLLVIDDDPAAQELIARALSKQKVRIVTAQNGRDGLELAKKLHPDVITLDVLMPGMDGWEVLSILKSDEDLEEIPVIMLTIVENKNRGFALGASDYLTKPIDRRHLIRVMAHYRQEPGGTVLIVEDAEAEREMLQRTLSEAGWRCLQAKNGKEALEQLQEQQPDVVLLDLLMPKMDGFEFIEALQNLPEPPDLPIIVVTAKDLSPEDHRRLNGYVEAIMQKGAFSNEELLARVRRALSE